MLDGRSFSDPDPKERRARIRLARSARVGPTTFHEALGHFGSARAACERMSTVSEAIIAREESALASLDGKFLVFGDADYPAALAALPDAPPVLSAIGDTALLARPTLAVVGAREASAAGRRFAGDITRMLGAAGLTIASGLARGIDGAAHEAALETGTVAVLAGGIDQIYPLQNSALYHEIARHGLVLAESPHGAPPLARAFPRRNRIVSGVSLGVVVVEARGQSGSMITARMAAEQGREVFVVPGSPMDPRYAGSNSLIREGATLVRDANDILISFDRPFQNINKLPPSFDNKQEICMSTAHEAILSELSSVPTAVDEVVRRCQVSAAAVADVLLSLELEGRLERHRGNRISLI